MDGMKVMEGGGGWDGSDEGGGESDEGGGGQGEGEEVLRD